MLSRCDEQALSRGQMVGLALGTLMGALVLSAFGYFSADPKDADIKADWLVATALVRGDNPYSDPRALAERYSVEYVFSTADEASSLANHPRTPGALVLLAPLAWVPFGALVAIATASQVVLLLLAAGLVAIRTRMTAVPSFLVSAALVASGPSAWSARWATQSAVLGGLIAIAWTGVENDRTSSGVALGLAATLRLFPLVGAVALLGSPGRRALRATGATFAALNLGPLALPNVALEDAVRALTQAPGHWFTLPGNISAASSLTTLFEPRAAVIWGVSGLLAVLGIAVVLRPGRSVQDRLLLGTCVGILASPIAWPPYLLAVAAPATSVITDNTIQLGTRVAACLGLMLMIPALPVVATYRAGLLILTLSLVFARTVRNEPVGSPA